MEDEICIFWCYGVVFIIEPKFKGEINVAHSMIEHMKLETNGIGLTPCCLSPNFFKCG